MTDQRMTDDERALLEHRWAVRVNAPTDAHHVATLALRLLDVARYAGLAVPAEIRRATVELEAFASEVERQVAADRAELERSGRDVAGFQRALERAFQGGERR
jgi:hypothetical protein